MFMLRRTVSIALVALLVNLFLSNATYAGTKEEKEAKAAAKVKANIEKLGTGKEARIQVKLKDGMKLKGYVSQINESSFTVTDDATGTTTEVPYPQAKQVKGNNLSTGAKIAIGVGIVVVVLVILHFATRGA